MKNFASRVRSAVLIIPTLLSVLMLSSCIYFNAEPAQHGGLEYAYYNLNVVLPPGDVSEENKRTAAVVQEHLDSVPIALLDGELNFLFLSGTFYHAYQEIHIIGVIVNATDSVITNFSGDLILTCVGSGLHLDSRDTINFHFTDEYAGELAPSDAMLAVFRGPITGPNEDVVIGTFDFSAEFQNVTYTTK